MENQIKRNFELLFERPQEPCFMAKGSNNAAFDLPVEYFNDRYRPVGTMIQQRFEEMAQEKIPLKRITLPDLRLVMSLGRRDQFSLFIPRHRKLAGRMIDIFMGMRSLEDLQCAAVYARDRCNPYLFNYALSVALLHRQDTSDFKIPPLCQVFPDKFIDSQVFANVREEANIMPDGSRMPIVIPRDYTASDRSEEHRLWYFREDMGVNMHHWHWHLTYPYEASDRALVDKDRRGELFYYMHQQIIARYNVERFSNHLARVDSFNNFRQTITEGYYPKMDSTVASRSWPGRAANVVLRDINREVDNVKLDVENLERWRDRIYEAVERGFAITDKGERVPLDNEKGIDVIGNMLESSILSPNRQLYGDLHNMGHLFISFCHDPDNRHLESFAVMGDTTTAMRDPMFYRWHSFIDDICQLHKNRLPPYTINQIGFPGVTVSDVEVAIPNGEPNVLQTFWQESEIELSRGLDFIPRGDIFIRFTHLQHEPFAYRIIANNEHRNPRRGTVRIFLGPRSDERGHQLQYNDQRGLMIELDRFVTTLRPGRNVIVRHSSESNVTIPYERTFRYLSQEGPPVDSPEIAAYNQCGCGWPDHMLIPRGLPEGFQCHLFVMISDFNEDKVEQEAGGGCDDAIIFCGLRDRLYPDRRSMGYPFDRPARTGVDRLGAFLTPNMFVQDVRIFSSERIVPGPTQ